MNGYRACISDHKTPVSYQANVYDNQVSVSYMQGNANNEQGSHLQCLRSGPDRNANLNYSRIFAVLLRYSVSLLLYNKIL